MGVAHYHFIAASENCRAYVRLNGVPLIATEPGPPIEQSADVSMWVGPGASALEVSLARDPRSPDAAARFFGSLVPTGDGEDPRTAAPAWDLRWPPEGLGDLVPFYRLFELPTQTPSQLWARAEPLDLNDDLTLADIVERARELHALFAAGRHAALADSLGFRAEDLARVAGVARAIMEVEQRTYLEHLMTTPDFAAHPLHLGELSFRLLCDARVVQVRCARRPLLLSTEGRGLEIHLSRIDGAWCPSR